MVIKISLGSLLLSAGSAASGVFLGTMPPSAPSA